MHVLILGGTTEARRLAELLHRIAGCTETEAPGHGGASPLAEGPGARSEGPGGDPALARTAPAQEGPRPMAGRLRVTSSLAGRVAAPRMPPGEVRIGGFGGTAGLARWLQEHRVDALIDATHPFARTISFHAAEAAASARVPLLALRRPGWVPQAGDDWHAAGSLDEAAALLPALGRRAFLTTGRTGLAAFAALDRTFFLVRCVDPPEPPGPPRMQVLLDRGPFTLDGERALLRRHRIDVVVTKNSGGSATAAKLTAAREAGIPVLMVARPPVPEPVTAVRAPEDALAWLRTLTPSGHRNPPNSPFLPGSPIPP